MNLNTICHDNFFENPQKIRNIALSCMSDYDEDPNGIWPGKRVSDVPEFIMRESLIKCRQIFNNQNLDIFDCLFATISNRYGDCGWCHYDSGYAKYSTVVYLNHNPPPNTGTLIYDNYLNYNFLENYWKKFSNKRRNFLLKKNKNFIDKIVFDARVKKFNQKFEHPSVKIENKFNRFIGFDSSLIHRIEKNFGNDDNHARLCFVSFLK